MKYSFFIILLFSGYAKSQANFIRDTSFTAYSAYIKEKTNFPFIEIANEKVPASVGVKSNVIYKSVGDRPLRMDVYYPLEKVRKKYPAVVLLHGGGWRSGDKNMTWPMAIALAEKGFVAVAVEYRLSTEAQYPAGMHDIRNAIANLRKHAKDFLVHTDKIAVAGTSSGGQMAALLGTTNQYGFLNPQYTNGLGNVQAVIDIDGILAFKHPESAEGKVAAEWLGGTYEEKPETWKEASALYHVDRHAVPILFINSSLPRFHAGRDDMIAKLDSLHIYSEVHTFPNTPHPFWLFHPWFQPTVQYMTDFLQKVFKTGGKKQ